MDDDLLTESLVRALVPDKIFQRGDRYCANGAIVTLMRRGGMVHALVQGSQYDPYSVELTARGDRILARCGCPYAEDSGAWCKHVVAVMLTLCRRKMPVVEQPTLHELLDGVSREGLVRIVEGLVEMTPSHYDAVRAMVEHGEGGPPRRPWMSGEGWVWT